MKFPAVVAFGSVAAFLGADGYTVLPDSMSAPIANLFSVSPRPMIIENGVIVQRGSTCSIKGNVSIISRERIYQVPGQHYDVTKISPEYGERWFCSEAEARAAGWRRAGY
ncbi:hypothetical protein ASC97_29840 [Rhizobium sp. Root1203]|uniref:sunset domain-containing protein n=1 Tax=Rhizobium sp. Root1203 TaxID=1736427 RepID=UPI00070EC234|nr:hypothetical protein [Rhizobium sp. Root1203]KQV18261.1 hypothetical protein ASC97_29840 [Rhizobium sp. Root1203]